MVLVADYLEEHMIRRLPTQLLLGIVVDHGSIIDPIYELLLEGIDYVWLGESLGGRQPERLPVEQSPNRAWQELVRVGQEDLAMTVTVERTGERFRYRTLTVPPR